MSENSKSGEEVTEQANRNKARRKLLKTLATGGGVLAAGKMLPEQWVKPAIDATLVPAHAQASPGGGGVFDNGGLLSANDNGTGSGLLDLIVPTANAQVPVAAFLASANVPPDETTVVVCMAEINGDAEGGSDNFDVAPDGSFPGGTLATGFSFNSGQLNRPGGSLQSVTLFAASWPSLGTARDELLALGTDNCSPILANITVQNRVFSPYDDEEQIV